VKRYVLAGDVGGTKTDLALYSLEPKRVEHVREQSFRSAAHASLEEILRAFLKDEPVAAAAFGIPGPVIDERVVTTNLPWPDVTAAGVGKALGVPSAKVALLNDLETTAHGALCLPAEEFQTLNRGVTRRGNGAVIAAGTGLGQAFLYWDGQSHRPSATEGGHADFAPSNRLESELLDFVRDELEGGHVSWERIVSGPGLHTIFRFLTRVRKFPVEPRVRAALEKAEDPSAVIGKAGVEGGCVACVEALDLFVSLYGAQAGNLALTVMATGGIYIGGGIVTKILPRMAGFMKSFVDKGRYHQLLSEIPVAVILNPRASRIGAAVLARRLAERD